MSHYAVKKGRVPGIYGTWAECEAQVKGYSGAVYQKFPTHATAAAWLTGSSLPTSVTRVTSSNSGVTVRLVTDGACSGNPGPGGAAGLVFTAAGCTEIVRAFRMTTNNRMELMAAIIGLEAVAPSTSVNLVTDSRYALQGIAAPHRQQKNADLWQRLAALLSTRSISPQWIEGHAGHADNSRADKLAVAVRINGPWEEDTGYTP